MLQSLFWTNILEDVAVLHVRPQVAYNKPRVLQSEPLNVVAWNQRAPGESPSQRFVCESTKHHQWLMEAREEQVAGCRPTVSQTCSIGDMSGERAGQGSSGTRRSLIHRVATGLKKSGMQANVREFQTIECEALESEYRSPQIIEPNITFHSGDVGVKPANHSTPPGGSTANHTVPPGRGYSQSQRISRDGVQPITAHLRLGKGNELEGGEIVAVSILHSKYGQRHLNTTGLMRANSDSPARSGDGTLVPRDSITLIAPAILGPKKEQNDAGRRGSEIFLIKYFCDKISEEKRECLTSRSLVTLVGELTFGVCWLVCVGLPNSTKLRRGRLAQYTTLIVVATEVYSNNEKVEMLLIYGDFKLADACVLIVLLYCNTHSSVNTIINSSESAHVVNSVEGRRNPSQSEQLYRERYLDNTPSYRGMFSRLQRNRLRTRTDEAAEVVVLAAVAGHPHVNTRQIEAKIGIPKTSARLMLKHHAVHSNHVENLVVLCQWAQHQIVANSNFFPDDIFTYVSSYYDSYQVNTRGMHYWVVENPRWLRQMDHQRLWRINIWCGMVGNKVIGLYVVIGSRKGREYATFT
ncbi:hypothetical protein PR048_025716 [Dryococelus australis]|uniref:Uncharacterized protein n=1 Tax=Dryococelus australis TaxID=614101 RepID=A0ABQ9GJB5_9NEOP|nr:hypothetical protein PR048_025716 [Dryococelus australis]